MSTLSLKHNAVFVCFPGLIILIFGMLALHSTVSLIRSTSGEYQKHKDYINIVIEFQNDYYDFTERLKTHLSDNGKNSAREIKKEFSSINDDFVLLRKTYSGYGANSHINTNAEHFDNAHMHYVIGQGLKNIARDLMLFEQTQKPNDKKTLKAKLEKDVHETYQVVFNYQKSILQSHKNLDLYDAYRNKELWLYWSVILMGLTGFILVLLNGQKLQELRTLSTERLNAFDTMQKRLAALEMAKDGFLMVERDEKLTYINKSLEKMLGLQEGSRESYYNKDWREIFAPDDARKMDEHALPMLRETGHWMDMFEITNRDGHIVYTEMSATLLPDGGMIGTIQDISARHKAEMDKNDMEAQFYQAQKMEAIGRLAGGIAHDFNNILAAMNGYAEFLIDDLDKGSEQQKFAENILSAGNQAKDLVDQVLTFSRLGDSVQEAVNVVSVINEARIMLDATAPKTIELVTNIPSDTIPIFANATKISQIIMNLCVNAIDAMDNEHGELGMRVERIASEEIDEPDILKEALPTPDETPLVRISENSAMSTKLILGHVVKGSPYAKISISDTGTGMSRTVMEHVFEPFFTTKSVDEGTGLGLATVHGVIVSHSAMLVINSELGKGTTFDIYIPELQIEDKAGLPQNNKHDHAGDNTLASHAQKRILVVEDQDFVLKMTMSMLERMGFEAHYAVNGLDGVEIIRENPGVFDLIITDYNMPKMSGLEMTQQIFLDHPDLPIILLSGYSEEKIQDLLKDHPSVKAVLKKPVEKDKLEKTIKGVFDAGKIGAS